MGIKIFTFIVIGWVFYQLSVHYLQKEKQRNTRSSSGPFKIPPMESWQEQLRQHSEKGPYQAGPFELTELKRFEETGDYHFETEGTSRFEGTLGTEVASGFEGTLGTEVASRFEGTLGTEGFPGIEGTDKYAGTLGQEIQEGYKSLEVSYQKNAVYHSVSSSVPLSLTQRELVKAVVWAEILGKPRALRPFRGPRF